MTMSRTLTLAVAVGAAMMVVAQSNPDGVDPASVSQDRRPPDPFTSCTDMRRRLQDEFYAMYKGLLPRRLLKVLLPLFVEPLLVPECASAGYSAWIKSNPSGHAPARAKRAFLGLDFFLPGTGAGVKDPGDAPAGSSNHLKDPGDRFFDRMFAGTGMPAKDPSDHPMTTASALSRWSQVMSLARMMSPRPQAGGTWSVGAAPHPREHNPYQKQNRGGVYGDTLPGRRRKRATNCDNGDCTDVVTFGDITMPTDTFNKIVAPDRPDRKDSSYNRYYHPPATPYYPPQQNYFPPPQNPYNNGQQNFYPRQYLNQALPSNYMYQDQAYNNRAAHRLQQLQLQALAARLSHAYYGAQQTQNFPHAQLFSQPHVPYTPPQPSPPQVYGSQLPSFGTQASVKVIPQTPVHVPPAATASLTPGSTSPAAGTSAAPSRRVKRASSEEESSSSDPSPTDVVTFGDVTLPTDTFNKMISPLEEPRLRPYYPPPVYYSPFAVVPPLYYPPPPAPYYHHNYHPPSNRNYIPNGNYVSNGNYIPNGNYVSNGNYIPNNRLNYIPNNNGFISGTNGPPLPMGAARPLVYGNGPTYY